VPVKVVPSESTSPCEFCVVETEDVKTEEVSEDTAATLDEELWGVSGVHQIVVEDDEDEGEDDEDKDEDEDTVDEDPGVDEMDVAKVEVVCDVAAA